jgi:hypothetical protein
MIIAFVYGILKDLYNKIRGKNESSREEETYKEGKLESEARTSFRKPRIEADNKEDVKYEKIE